MHWDHPGVKQKNNLLYLRTAKTASSFIAHWCGISGIPCTYNQLLVDHPFNLNYIKKANFIFTSVRNPYRRAYSCYKYFQQDPRWTKDFGKFTFSEFLDLDFALIRNIHLRTHIQPISYYLKPLMNKIDYIIKIENLEEHMLDLFKRFESKVAWVTPHIKYETMYDKAELRKVYEDENIREKVKEAYRDDFIKFNYTYDDYKNLYPEIGLKKEDTSTVKL